MYMPGLPVAVCDDGYCIAEVYDFTNARHILYGCRVYRSDGVAEYGCGNYGCVFHARQYDVNAEFGGAVNLGRDIKSLNVCAHDRKFFFGLERWFRGYREFCHLSCETGVRRGTVTRPVMYMTVPGFQFVCRNSPDICRGLL